jgi:hypothetical protein
MRRNQKRESTTTRLAFAAGHTTVAPRLLLFRLILGFFGVLLAVYLPARLGRRFMTLSSLLMLESSTVAPNVAATVADVDLSEFGNYLHTQVDPTIHKHNHGDKLRERTKST